MEVGGTLLRATAREMHRAFLLENVVLGRDAGAWISHPRRGSSSGRSTS